jgi:hypothetical protein
MLSRVRSHLTYANVVASIALFIAIGGGAYAAITLPANSVGTKQLKRNAVTAQKVKNSAITTGKIANRAVTRAKLADNAVGGGQLDVGSVQGLIKGAGSQSSRTFTAPATGFLASPAVLADIPGFGQVRFLYCGNATTGLRDEIRIQVLSNPGTSDFIDVSSVHAANLPSGTGQPEFSDFGGGHLSNGGGDILVGHPGAGAISIGVAEKFDVQLFRGSGPSATSAHVSISGLDDSTTASPTTGSCFVTAETIEQP